jgi:aryl-alcohol dehydrogenase-like predicted oxidoreductase
LNRLALGTAQFGLPYGIANQVGQVTRLEAKRILQFGIDNGIDTLDTAIIYGDSEKFLGELGTQGFNLVTKLPAVPIDCPDLSDWVKSQVSASLSRLGVTSIYGLLVHQSEQLLGPHGAALYNELQLLKENGKVQKIGISIYSPIELQVLAGQYHFDLVQAPFNLIDQRLYRTGWLKRLKDPGVEVHARSVFLQGLLLMKQADMPDKFLHWAGLWQKWYNWLEEYDGSAAQACLSLPLSFSEIDKVVVGVDSLNQLSQIVSAANKQQTIELPDLQCQDQNLINPVNWPTL